MKVTYPVIFTETETNILIEVPDLHILTEANAEEEEKGTVADAIMMARDAIGLHCIAAEDDGKEIPKSSRFSEINVCNGTFAEAGQGVVSLVDVDLMEYRKRVDNRAVRRNVTLPNWLNVEAEKAHINVSRVLQEALMERIGAR